jgi:hypothetical protein
MIKTFCHPKSNPTVTNMNEMEIRLLTHLSYPEEHSAHLLCATVARPTENEHLELKVPSHKQI